MLLLAWLCAAPTHHDSGMRTVLPTINQMSKKPLVVIAGWLGCRERFLIRYKNLHEQLGMDVLTVIAPPLAVMEATLQHEEDGDQMDAVARNVLNHIEERRPRHVVFHLFSNGGCFLWERIRRRMERGCRHGFAIAGVIFDSCPAWFGNPVSPLSSVLERCTEEEKRVIRDRFGVGIWGTENYNQTRHRKQRNRDFFAFIQGDPLDVPHLYFYCRNDQLAGASRIHQVIVSRRREFQRPILEKVWETSVHCAHILQHTQEYQQLLTDFLTMALGRSSL